MTSSTSQLAERVDFIELVKLQNWTVSGYLGDRLTTTFGKNLRAARLRSRLAAKDVAERMGVSASGYSNLEKSRRGAPKLATLWKAAIALGCSVDELIAGLNADYDAVVKRDLSRPSADQESGATPSGGSPTDDQRAEVPPAIQREIDQLLTALASIEATAEDIATAARAARRAQGSRTASPKPSRRRPRRASG